LSSRPAWGVAGAFAIAASVACSKERLGLIPANEGPSASVAPALSTVSAPSTAPVEITVHDAAPTPPKDEARPLDLAAYATAAPVSRKSIGHTSVVLKLKLEGGLEAAYKPSSKRGPTRYKGEIAAYRLATALGLPNVPPAIPRSFSRSSLLEAAGPSDTQSLLAVEALETDAGDVPGALIPWIPHLTFVALEKDPLLSEWTGWLSGTLDIPEAKRGRAAQISTLVVFDYVTGNWDRWSGGNIGEDAGRDMLLFIDNDGAFYDKPPEAQLAAQKARLEAIARFSRGFVERLRKVDATALAAAIGDERPGVPLLGARALAGVDARRHEALRIIDARVEKTGEARVLAFE
jgi:hypothetical protein